MKRGGGPRSLAQIAISLHPSRRSQPECPERPSTRAFVISFLGCPVVQCFVHRGQKPVRCRSRSYDETTPTATSMVRRGEADQMVAVRDAELLRSTVAIYLCDHSMLPMWERMSPAAPHVTSRPSCQRDVPTAPPQQAKDHWWPVLIPCQAQSDQTPKGAGGLVSPCFSH